VRYVTEVPLRITLLLTTTIRPERFVAYCVLAAIKYLHKSETRYNSWSRQDIIWYLHQQELAWAKGTGQNGKIE